MIGSVRFPGAPKPLTPEMLEADKDFRRRNPGTPSFAFINRKHELESENEALKARVAELERNRQS